MTSCGGIDSALGRLEGKINSCCNNSGNLESRLAAVGLVAGTALARVNPYVAGVAGLLGLANLFKNQIGEALNRGLQNNNRADQLAGKLHAVGKQIEAANGRALNALQEAYDAGNQAKKANDAINKANEQTRKANEAIAKANDTIAKNAKQANDAIKKANGDIAKQNAAIKQAQDAARNNQNQVNAANAQINQLTGALQKSLLQTKQLDGYYRQEIGKLSAQLKANASQPSNNNIPTPANQANTNLTNQLNATNAALKQAQARLAQAEFAQGYNQQLTNDAIKRANLAAYNANIARINNQIANSRQIDTGLINQLIQANPTVKASANAVAASKPISEKALADAFRQYNVVPNLNTGLDKYGNVVRISIAEASKQAKDAIKNAHNSALEQIKQAQNQNLGKLTDKGLLPDIEKAIKFSPTIIGLKEKVNNPTVPNNTLAPEITKIKERMGVQEKVNEESNKKLDNIAKTLPGIESLLLAIPATINPKLVDIAKQTTPEALRNAAAAGTCQTTQPGGCTSNAINGAVNRGNQDLYNKLNAGGQLLDLALLKVIDKKLGPQMPGGLSGKLGRMAQWLKLDRAWAVLTYAAVLHNAWMLSSSFGQTLLAATNSFVKAFILTDDEGESFDIGQILGKQVEDTAKAIFGEKTVTYWETQYKKYVRVYQAAANLLGSLTSIGYSILSVLEIIGSRISRIGNALRYFGAVGDQAYSAMNEADNFQNPYINRITRLEEAASSIDQVSTEVINVRQTAVQLKTQKKELDDAVKAATATADKEEAKESAKIKVPDYSEAEVS